jgi:NADH:ubiquinone oxidoreductase subunit E
MQSDAWIAFATNDVREMDRSSELLADAFSVRDIEPPVCIDCLANVLHRPKGEVVDEVMSMYTWFDLTLNESGHCRICSRRTVVVG